MKRFDFQLEALLKIRKMEAEQAQRALSEAIKRLSFAQKIWLSSKKIYNRHFILFLRKIIGF